MRSHRLWVVGVTLVAAAVLAGRPAHGQESCYQGFGPSMVNICPTASQDIDYRVKGTYGVVGVTVGGISYAFDIHGNSLDVFDFTNPTAPNRLTSSAVNIPWWPPPDGGSDPSLINRLRGLATLDGFPYALGTFYTDGWDFFKLGTNTFLRKGYSPTLKTRYLNTALFRIGTEVYAVGQLLDATAISQNDLSVYLYLVSNGSNITPETINYTTMANNRSRVPIGGSGDGAYAGFALGAGSTTFYPFVVGSQAWLLVANTNGQVVTVNVSKALGILVSTPTGPIWTASTDPNLFSGPWAVDRDHAILHVASRDFTTVYSYDIHNPQSGPVSLDPLGTPWHGTGSSPNCVLPVISAGGGVIAVGCGAYAGYIPTDQNGVPVPPALADDTSSLQATFVNPTQCNPSLTLGPFVRGLSVFVTPSQQTCVARAVYSWGDVIALNDSCLSTVPSPKLTVARNANQGTLDGACSGGDAKGYPGDTFTITNTSSGKWSNPILYYTPPGGSRQILANPMPTPYTWTPPTSGPTGQWGFDLDVTDDAGSHYLASAQTPPGNRTINLCGSPGAGITKTPTTYLTGDTVTLSAAPPASQGNPSGYDWHIVRPSPDAAINPTGPSYGLALARQGTYTAYVRVHYAHAATDDPTCSQSPFNTMPAVSGYDSCKSISLDSQPFSVGALTLSQTPPPSGGNYLLGQPITLSVPYKLGAGYTATFAWALDNPTNTISAFNPTPATRTAGGTSISENVTGTIPANYFTVAGAHTVYLVSSATNGGTPVVPTPQPFAGFNVVNCQPAAAPSSLHASVSGQAPNATVTLSWSGSGTAPINYHAYTTPIALFSCDSVDATSCAIAVTSAGTYQFKVNASNACSGTLTSAETGSFTVTGGTPPPTPTPAPTESANFTFSPTNPQVLQQVSFYGTASGGTPTKWEWTFGDGFGPIGGGGGTSNLQNPTYPYGSDGTFTVTLKVTFLSGNQRSVSKPITVSKPCTATGPPTSSFTFVSPARATIPVQFTDTSTGGPTAWSWDFGDGKPPIIGAHTSTAQNPTNTFATPGTYTVKLTATNCKGSNTTQRQVEVVGACDLTEPPPTPDFFWGPTGPYPGNPDQQQPFVGQPVTLVVSDTTTGQPTSWQWYDFQELMLPPTSVTSSTFTATWNEPGDKNVRMKASNCFGQSAEVLKTIHIYDDVRPVVADFSWSPSSVTTDAQVTFTAAQGLAYGNPTSFTWSFDNGSTQTGSSVTYSFKCGGSRTVTLTAARGSATDTATKSVAVDGPTCGPESVMAVDAAKVQGANGTNWHADVRIYNPSAFSSIVTVEFLPVGWDNFTRNGSFRTLAPRETWVIDDILQWAQNVGVIGTDVKKTALRVTYTNDDDVQPVVTVRTYNLLPDGSKYGQINPGVNVVPGTTPPVQWLTGLRNNGLIDGFRTNYSIVNLRGDAGGVSGITFTLFDAAGIAQATKTFGLAPFGYVQDSIKALFGPAFEDIGTFSLKVEAPTDSDVQVYASVMDNQTSDPVMIPASVTPDSPIYVPAMAHLSGEANTVWRSDIQLTNPDTSNVHTWEVRYTPKGTSLPVIARSLTLDPGKSIFVDDLIAAVYADSATPLPEDAQTSGIVRIAPTDGSAVYPVVATRSYNQTPTGTFGQGIPPLWAAKGLSAGDSRRLVLTGMSSEDIARTNLGFVNLSETQGVNLVVYFYDQAGHVLNPLGTDNQPKPYTYAIGPGTWDQDKLENRFKNAFKVPLPPGLRAVTAEIRVSDGGPGFAYASVIDTKTGDPNFIPAQLTP